MEETGRFLVFGTKYLHPESPPTRRAALEIPTALRNVLLSLKGLFLSFTYIALDAAKKLVTDGCKLVGIDYLSVEKFKSPEPVVHKTLLRAGIIIMEGLFLKDVDKYSIRSQIVFS